MGSQHSHVSLTQLLNTFLANRSPLLYLRVDGVISGNSIQGVAFSTFDDFLCVVQQEHAEEDEPSINRY